MARKIGALAATLTLKSQQFSKGLKKARGRLRGFTRSIKRMGSTLKSLPGLAAIGGVGGIVFILKKAGDAIDNIGRVSTRLGIGTKELSRLQFAAKTAGIDSKNLELSLQRMTRRVAEAAKGTGEAKKAIAAMGLSAKELVQLSPDKMLARFADKLKDANGPADRLRIAFKLFDSEGAKLVQLLERGSDGLKELGDVSDRVGATVSELDVVKVQRAKLAIDTLVASVSGLARRVAVDLSPAIEGLANALSSLNFQTLSLGPNIIELGRGIVKVASFVSQSFIHLAKPFIGLSAIFEGVTTGSLKQSRETIKSLEDALEFLDFNSIDDFFNPIADAAVNTAGAIEKTTKSVFNLSNAFGKSGKRSPFSAAIELGSQAAAKATFKFNQDASAAQNASLALGREILRATQKIERQIGTPNTQVRIG